MESDASEKALAFFESTHQNFLTAIANTGEINLFYRITEFTFCLRFAGNAMLNIITPALAHLKIDEPEQCDLTICIWDSISTRSNTIDLPAQYEAYAIRGEMRDFNTDNIAAVLDIHTKTLNLFNKKNNIALHWINNAQKLPWWASGSPLQLILHWWLRVKNHQLTHAAVVGNEHGGLLLTGKSGSGKSTTTLSCMKLGLKYVSEDYCVINDSQNIKAYSIYNSAKIEEKTLHFFPELRKNIANNKRKIDEKAFFYHQQFQPEKILHVCSLKAIVALKIVDKVDSWIEDITPQQALPALSVSTIWQLTHTGLPTLKHLKKLSESLPCYQLYLGNDLMQAPKLLTKLL